MRNRHGLLVSTLAWTGACAVYTETPTLHAGGTGGKDHVANTAGTAGSKDPGMSAGGAAGGAGTAPGGAEVGGAGGAAPTGGGAGQGGAAGIFGGGAGSAGDVVGAGGRDVARTFRHFKLVALTEQRGGPWISLAELQIMSENIPLDRSDWVPTADSQEIDDEPAPASDAIDGSTATYWHTAWEHPPDDVNDPKPPHWLMVDLGAPKSISGFSCLPRQTGTNGRIKDWEVYGSQDGKSWGDPLKGGAFSDDDELHTVLF